MQGTATLKVTLIDSAAIHPAKLDVRCLGRDPASWAVDPVVRS